MVFISDDRSAIVETEAIAWSVKPNAASCHETRDPFVIENLVARLKVTHDSPTFRRYYGRCQTQRLPGLLSARQVLEPVGEHDELGLRTGRTYAQYLQHRRVSLLAGDRAGRSHRSANHFLLHLTASALLGTALPLASFAGMSSAMLPPVHLLSPSNQHQGLNCSPSPSSRLIPPALNT